nr:EOG090X0971 [Eulimnadia texana]
MSVVIETTLGDLTVDLYTKQRPRTCMNFLKLCKIKFYNFSLFYHVERNFVAQTGDPLGTGRGGESVYGKLYGEQAKYFEAELIPKLKHVKPGTLSMVNVGDNMLGSQFFITLGEDLEYLDGEHCVFGEVVEGFETLMKINDAIVDEKHIPYQDIRITHTVVLDDPFDDPPGLVIPDRSPELTKEIRESGRIGADEDINEMQGKSIDEIEELLAEKEAKARATILEMIGDIPDADVAPPENVLFVCKLNPVTTEDDLMIIFSRFGKIVSCEVIKDHVTGNSLQYAFIEFDNPKSCEDAYFKMDNVLIDDRRIHVDFSQSVSKIRWKGKGRGVEFAGGKSFDPNAENKRQQRSGRDQRRDFEPSHQKPRDQRGRNDWPRDQGNQHRRHERDRRRSRSRDRRDSRERYRGDTGRNSSWRERDRRDDSRERTRRKENERERERERERTKRKEEEVKIKKEKEESARRHEKEEKKKRRRTPSSSSTSSTSSSSSSSSEEERKKKKSKKKSKDRKEKKRRSVS